MEPLEKEGLLLLVCTSASSSSSAPIKAAFLAGKKRLLLFLHIHGLYTLNVLDDRQTFQSGLRPLLLGLGRA